MFVDLIGYTGLTSRLDPEELCRILRRYQAAMAAEIARFEGVVSTFLGDGVLAYFGFPQAHEDDAERAICAGLAVIDAAGRLAGPSQAPLRVRIGIATGLVVVGDPGGPGASEWSAVGETPTLAARLQELAAPDTILVADRTRRLAGGLFAYEGLGGLAVKGFGQPIRAWQVLGRSTAVGRFEARQAQGRTPLVGRAVELDCLRSHWNEAVRGVGRVALICGEAGIGKSRLVQEFRGLLRGQPHMPLHCRCSPFHTGSPLQPVIEELARAADFAANDGAAQWLAKLERLLALATADIAVVTPLIAELLSLSTEGRYPPLNLPAHARRERTLDALVGQLDGLARRAPVLLVLEDAHWCDPTSLELFDRLIDLARALPVLIVITYRPEFASRWAVGGQVASVILDRLDASEARSMVRKLDSSLPDAVVEQLVEKADGVPLFVEELTRAALDRRDTGPDRQSALESALLPPVIPSTLQDSLVARLDKLPEAREVAQTAACLGREFDHELLAAVSPLSTPELDRVLDDLASAGILIRRGDCANRHWRFKHALVRDAAHATLLHRRRRQLHARIVAIMESRFPGLVATHPNLLAQHCAEAGLIREAIDYWRQAGLAAAQRSAMREAVALLRHGLALIPQLPDPRDWVRRELDLQVALGAALLALKGGAAVEIEQAYGRARELSQLSGSLDVEAAVLWGIWHNHTNRAELARARTVVQEQLRNARRRADKVALAVAHRCGLVTELFSGAYAPALAHLDELMKLSSVEDGPPEILLDPWISGQSMATWPLLIRGQVKQAIASSEEMLAAARGKDRPYLLAVVMHHQTVFSQLLGDRETVARRACDLHSLAARHGFAHWHATATLLSGWAIAGSGDLADGIATMRRGLEAKKATGSRLKLPYYQALLSELVVRAGDKAEALALLDDALAQVATSQERWFAAELHRRRAELVLSLRGRRAEAEMHLLDAIRIAHRQDAKLFQLRAANSLAHLWAARGERRRAGDLLAPALIRVAPAELLPEAETARAMLEALR